MVNSFSAGGKDEGVRVRRQVETVPGIRGILPLSLVMLLLLASPRPIQGQVVGGTDANDRPFPGWVGQFTVLGVNAVVGGLTAGISQHWRGGSFSDGFTRGFVGGSVVYTGKRVAGENFFGAGALGRGVVGVGASIIRNASEERPSLDTLILPLGPLRLYVAPEDWRSARVKLDANQTVVVLHAATRSELKLDLVSSLSAGAPVFTADRHLFGTAADTTRASGQVVENVIFLSDLEWRPERERAKIFAHERIHVLQRDQVFTTIADPLGQAVLDRFSFGTGLRKYVDVHVTDLIFNGVGVLFDYYDRPWEMEAYHLTDTGPRR